MDRVVARLAPTWALGADANQWIVLKARRHRGRVKWQPVAFVATRRAVLVRVLREKGAEMTPEGRAFLNVLPPTFREWRDQAKREAA